MKKIRAFLVVAFSTAIICFGCGELRQEMSNESGTEAPTSTVAPGGKNTERMKDPSPAVTQVVYPTPICYIVGDFNSIGNLYVDKESGVPVGSEIRQWDGTIYDSEDALLSRTIRVGGEQFSGEYRYSRYDLYNSYVTDYYAGEDGLQFAVNASTGELVYLNLMTKTFFSQEPLKEEIDDIETFGAEIAKRYASMFIPIEEYEQLDYRAVPYQPNVADPPSMTNYQYTFMRRINGVDTTAFVTIQITSKGNLSSIVVGDVDAVIDKESELKDRFEEIDLDAIATETMSRLFPNKTSYTCEVKQKFFVVTPDGEAGACVWAESIFSETIMGEVQMVQADYLFLVK